MSDNLPAVIEDDDFTVDGLEDFDDARISMPRIAIVGDEGTFKDSNTGEEFTVLTGIPLGMIRQRAMFPSGTSELGPPQCKSNDGEIGYPSFDGDEDRVFPWDDAGLNPHSQDKDEFGRVILKCVKKDPNTGKLVPVCPFAQWTKGKGGKNDKPRCTERHTYPFLYSKDGDTKNFPNAGILSIQSSSMSNSNKFLSGFKTSKKPLYSAVVQLTLDKKKNGMVKYSVVQFTKLGVTDIVDYAGFSEQYQGIREFLRRPPRFEGEGGPVEGDAASNADAKSTIDSQEFSSPVSNFGDDDEIPF